MKRNFTTVTDLNALVAQLEGDTSKLDPAIAEAVDKAIADKSPKSKVPAKKTSLADFVKPEYPVFRCVFDEEELAISTDDIRESTCIRREREEYPVVYLGDFADSEGVFEDGKHIDGIDGCYKVIANVNKRLRQNRHSLLHLAAWTTEVALADMLKPFGFFSTQVHPLEMMQPKTPSKLGGSTRRTRKTVRRLSSVERRAMRSEIRERRGDKRQDPDAQQQRKSRPKQDKPAPLAAYLENDELRQTPEEDIFGEFFDRKKIRDKEIKDAADIIDNFLRGDIPTEKEKPVRPEEKMVSIGKLTCKIGREFCKWAFETHNVKLQQIAFATGKGPRAKSPIMISSAITGTKRRSIISKLRHVENGKPIKPIAKKVKKVK